MPKSALVVSNLRCEYLTEPSAVDAILPRFSWVVAGDGRDRRQSAFQLAVIDEAGATVFDTGRVTSSEMLGHVYGGTALAPLSRYRWSVTVFDEDGTPSAPASSVFATGLRSGKWDAPWICVPPSKGAKPPEATILYRNPFRALNVSHFRKVVTLPPGVRSVWLYATALGTYRFFINGRRVGDDYLTPGFTDYHKRVEYNAYDVGSLISVGDNAIGALLGEGWYSGFVGLDSKRPGGLWGRKPQLSAFLLIETADGEMLRIETDGTWRHSLGGLIYSDMLKGEKFDARLHPVGWDLPGYDDGGWEAAGTDVGAIGLVSAAKAPPIKNTIRLKPKSVARAPDGAWVFDLGQNMVGFVEARVRVKPGQTVRLVHGEMLQADGNLYLENLRTANQEDVYIAATEGEITYAPTFIFHGFRYVGVYGLEHQPDGGEITGVVIHNALPEVSTFESSSGLLNQLDANITWSQRGNFVSVPMDCPQRDERLGWTADGQVFAPTAAYRMDIAAFFTKWLDDIVDDQSEEGAFPDVAPRANSVNDGAPGWGDAGVILPLLLHQRYGDTGIIDRMYEPMKRWVEFIRRNNPDHIRVNRNHNNYGDWLAIGQETPNDLVATAYYAWIADLMRQAAEIRGNVEDAASYTALHASIREAYIARYVASDGSIGSGSQTSYLLSLFAGLVPDELRDEAVGRLVRNIHDAGDRVQVGFLGVRHVCPVLSEHGHSDLAYKLALSTEFPSWGYSVVNGATTIWERWDGWTKDKGFQLPNMNSFNHYAYGSIGEWLCEWVAGIAPMGAAPGFARFRLRPTPGPGLDRCAVRFESPRGRIVSRWRRDGQALAYEFEVPANTRAIFEIPAHPGDRVTLEGGDAGFERVSRYGGPRAVREVGSGTYALRVEPA